MEWEYSSSKTRSPSRHATDPASILPAFRSGTKSRQLRFDIGECATELIAVAGVLACLEVALDACAREEENFPAPAGFEFRWSDLPLLFV